MRQNMPGTSSVKEISPIPLPIEKMLTRARVGAATSSSGGAHIKRIFGDDFTADVNMLRARSVNSAGTVNLSKNEFLRRK